jgi:hypothetical protein
MTAVLEEPLVSAPARSVLYAARREDLRLVRVPRYPERGASGQQVGETLGQVVVFRNGRLDVPLDGPIMLEDGREVDGAEINEWLQKHRRFGDADEGFFKVELAAPPVSEDEMNALVEAAMALDVEKLEEIVRQEEQGWRREALLRVAREGVERIHAFKAQHAAAEAEPEKPAAKAAAKPKE